MTAVKQILWGFVGGSLITGGILGGVGYGQYQQLSQKNVQLNTQVKRLTGRNQNLTTRQAALSEELEQLKAQREREYDQTLSTLLQAADNAGTDALYETGLKAWEAKDYPNAYFALAQVHKLNPAYKELPQYYPAVEKAYQEHQQHQRNHELNRTYAQAQDHQLKQEFAQAKVAYQRVLTLQPNHSEATVRLKQVSQALNTAQQQKEQAQKKQWLESTYQLGLEAQNLGRYASAKAAFESILADAPGYKDSPQRLKTINAELAKVRPQAQPANCFAQGVTLGNCARSGNPTQCSQTALASLGDCKNHPDFKKGLQSVSTGQSPPNPQDNLSLLKAFPDFLKNL